MPGSLFGLLLFAAGLVAGLSVALVFFAHRNRAEAQRAGEETLRLLKTSNDEKPVPSKEKTFLELLRAASQSANLEEAFQKTVDGVCAYLQWPVGHVFISSFDP